MSKRWMHVNTRHNQISLFNVQTLSLESLITEDLNQIEDILDM